MSLSHRQCARCASARRQGGSAYRVRGVHAVHHWMQRSDWAGSWWF